MNETNQEELSIVSKKSFSHTFYGKHARQWLYKNFNSRQIEKSEQMIPAMKVRTWLGQSVLVRTTLRFIFHNLTDSFIVTDHEVHLRRHGIDCYFMMSIMRFMFPSNGILNISEVHSSLDLVVDMHLQWPSELMCSAAHVPTKLHITASLHTPPTLSLTHVTHCYTSTDKKTYLGMILHAFV